MEKICDEGVVFHGLEVLPCLLLAHEGFYTSVKSIQIVGQGI